MRLMTLAAVTLLVACNGAEPDDNYPPELPLADEYLTCEVDEDCVIVELGLCDQCNGGLAVAVNESSESEVFDEYSESEPANGEWACTEVACAPLEPVCDDDGLCSYEQATMTP